MVSIESYTREARFLRIQGVCVCVCVCMCVHVYVYVCLGLGIQGVCLYVYRYVCLCVCVCVCVCVCLGLKIQGVVQKIQGVVHRVQGAFNCFFLGSRSQSFFPSFSRKPILDPLDFFLSFPCGGACVCVRGSVCACLRLPLKIAAP